MAIADERCQKLLLWQTLGPRNTGPDHMQLSSTRSSQGACASEAFKTVPLCLVYDAKCVRCKWELADGNLQCSELRCRVTAQKHEASRIGGSKHPPGHWQRWGPGGAWLKSLHPSRWCHPTDSVLARKHGLDSTGPTCTTCPQLSCVDALLLQHYADTCSSSMPTLATSTKHAGIYLFALL